MTTTKVLQAAYPPSSGLLSNVDSGTITGITCYGPTNLQLFDGGSTGALLYALKVEKPCVLAVSVAFTRGLYSIHKTHSACLLTIS